VAQAAVIRMLRSRAAILIVTDRNLASRQTPLIAGYPVAGVNEIVITPIMRARNDDSRQAEGMQ
jgi:hypothetical protein